MGAAVAWTPGLNPGVTQERICGLSYPLHRANSERNDYISGHHARRTKIQARPKGRQQPLHQAGKKGDHVFLVDGSGYVFRAYHALPPINRKSDGLQLNAVFGFCNMLWKLLRDMKPDEQPTHLAVVLDKSEKTFRTEMYRRL